MDSTERDTTLVRGVVRCDLGRGIGSLELRNPVLSASGTYGTGSRWPASRRRRSSAAGSARP
jgi:hypothetical protein